MRMSTALVALVVLVGVCAAADYQSMFANFKKDHGRVYASADEEAKRFAIFTANMKKAETLMQANPLAIFGANEFADMSEAEFKSRHNADKLYAKLAAKAKPSDLYTPEQLKSAVSSVDWRQKGAVTAVKNQGQCGSCWSFSTTGGIEGQWFLAGNALTSLSEQLLVSCDTIDDGCNGGLMDNAFDWLVQDNKGVIVTEASYPYVSGDGNVPACDNSGKQFGAKITGHQDLPKTEDQMAAWCGEHGPISIAVDATSWQTYMGGIMTNCISQQIDHGVLIVGFDNNNNPPYWVVKNSWGASWGESGYIRVQKGTNQCLITSYPTTSIVGSGPGPVPPTPPSPPSPSGSFQQKTCADAKCTSCKVDTLPQDTCIKGTSASFIAKCISDGLLVKTFSGSSCSGSYTEAVEPVDVCQVVFNPNGPASFVQNSCSGSPVPPSPPAPTPAPQAPPTSPPAPTGTMTQMDCSDAACTQGCSNNTFPLGQCLQLSGGGSATAACNSQGVLLTVYPLSQDCSGMSLPNQMAVDQCLQSDAGGYFENFCSSSSTMLATKAKAVRQTLSGSKLARIVRKH